MKLENSVRDIKADGCNDVILFDMMLHLMEKNYNLLIKDDELIDLEFVKSVHPETEEESKEYISAFNRSRCNQPDVEKLMRELANANQESVVRNNDFDAAICDSLTASLGVKGCTADVVDKDFVLREFFKSSDFSSVEDQATRNPKDWVIWPESVVESVEAADGLETDKIPVENCQPQKAQISVVEDIGQYLNETQDTEPTAASSQVETLAQGSHVMLTVDQVQRAPNATSNSNSSHNASLTECMASQNIAQITNISTLTNVGSNSQGRYPSSSDQSRVSKLTQDISILERVPCFIETENNGSDFQIADVKMEEVEHQECPTPNFSEIIDIKTDPDFSTYSYEWSQNSNPSCWNQSVNGDMNCPVKIEQVGSEGPVNQPSENVLGVVNKEIVEADDSKSLLTNFYQALSHSDYCSDENVETDTDGNNGGEATTTRSTRSTRSSVGSMDSDLYSPSLSDLDDFQDSLNDHQVFGSPLAPSEWLLDDSESSNLDSPIFPLPPMIPGTRQFDDGPAKTAVQLKFTFDQIIDPSIGVCSSSESQELFERDEISSQLLSTDSPSQFEHTDGAVLKIEDPQQETLECKWAWCGVECTGQEGLVRHIETCHVEPKKADQFTCLWDSCMRQARPFNARYKLLIHMRVHSGEKPNKCPFIGCPKAFSRLENLKIHQRSHTGERPYKCQYDGCLKAFSNSSDRAKHQRTHLDTKPYACQIDGCSKKYTDPSSLRKHIKNHTTPHSSVKTKKAATANGSHSNSRKSHSRKMTNEIHEQTGTISEGKYKTGGKEMDFDEVDSTAEFVPYDYSPVYFNDFDRKFNHYEENEETLTKSFIPFLTHGDSLFLS